MPDLKIPLRHTAPIRTAPSRPDGTKSRLRRWWPLLLAPIGLALTLFARQHPMLVERFYSEPVYPLMAGSIGALTSLCPLSLFELGVCAILLAVTAFLLFLVIHAGLRLCGRGKPLRIRWLRWLERLVKLASAIYFVFVISCGLNYCRPEFVQFSGLVVRDSSVQELAALCEELVVQANELRTYMSEDSTGVMQLTDGFRENAVMARESFGKLAEDWAVLPDLQITPKPVLNSWLMSMLQLTGQFTLPTFEANINALAPDYSIPSTICHELAHTRGFMREDEANFIGYLACRESDSLEFQYSGVALALIHATNRLYEVDQETFLRIDAMISDGVRRDFTANNAYWAQFEGPVAEVSEAVNNVYLKVNNQSDGVKSYGRMVDLLLADYRARHGME